MRLSDGITSLNVERTSETFDVELLSTQCKTEVADVLPGHVSLSEQEESWTVSYELNRDAKSLATSIQQAKTQLEKLRLAAKLSILASLNGQFNVPFLHPENIFIMGEQIFVVHFGLQQLMAPFTLSEEDFLARYKGLILAIFNTKNAFETLVVGEETSVDGFTQTLYECSSLEEVQTFINEAVIEEERKVKQKMMFVSKGRYQFFKYFGILAIIVSFVLGWFTYAYQDDARKQATIITAQTAFLTNNYAETQNNLSGYTLGNLPKSARYILAVSAVHLSDLTLLQKQAILNTVSPKSDDNTLNYWAYTGRGAFDEALDLAKNLGDSQLTLLAYTNLYEATKLNTTMNGAKKQELLDEYSKEIEELTKSLGQ